MGCSTLHLICPDRKETLTVVGVMALLGELSDVRKVCVTVILFMTVTVLLTHPDAIPLQKVACQLIAWQNLFFVSVPKS